ncbi:MAG: MBL fold metallo-hydrolase [Burkholderiales bacterium]|nr:MBL fold metallo-hydrolase [Anaerolineae bacterium]
MKIQLIRNATLLLDYAGTHILIDPDFGVKESRPSFTGKSQNPMVDLPLSIERILDGVELVIVSHLHSDHFDEVAQESVPKTLPLICQPVNEEFIRDEGFEQVTPLADTMEWGKFRITRTDGHHGLGEVGEIMKPVSGFVFQADGEPTLYWAGDTVNCDEVRAAIATFKPDVIVTHSCGAKWPDKADVRHLIVMDAAQTIDICRLAAKSVIVATHMEALDHATVSRTDLRSEANEAGVSKTQLRIPSDGGIIEFP